MGMGVDLVVFVISLHLLSDSCIPSLSIVPPFRSLQSFVLRGEPVTWTTKVSRGVANMHVVWEISTVSSVFDPE